MSLDFIVGFHHVVEKLRRFEDNWVFCAGTVEVTKPLRWRTPLQSKGVPTELARGGEVRSTSKARVEQNYS